MKNNSEPRYPFDMEKKMLDSLRFGDTKQGRSVLNEILLTLFSKYQKQFKLIQYRAIELAILIFRAGSSLGFTTKSMLENYSRYIALIQKSSNLEELGSTLHRILDDMSAQIAKFQKTNHASALKKAENYITENISRKINLKEIAEAAGFSAPYFSTIFKDEMGENFSSYLNRLRVEKVASMLIDTALPLNHIALSCGFRDQSWFSKKFKAHMGISPGKYRSGIKRT